MNLKLLKLFADLAALFALIGSGTASFFNNYQPVLPKQLLPKDKQ